MISSNNAKLVACASVSAIALAAIFLHHQYLHQTAPKAAAATPSRQSPFGIPPGPPPPPSIPKPASPEIAGKSKTFTNFKLRPFTAVKKNGSDQWASEDGKDPDVILQLAHNELEVNRLMSENSRIKKRELVYRAQTVPELLEQSRNTGIPLKSFTLPGVDGQEVNVEVIETHFNSSANAGSVIGKVAGQFGSMASVGFSNGCESYNIIDPAENIFLTADAREPGQVMVKQIDPDQYSPALGNRSEDHDPVGASVPKQVDNIPLQFRQK